MITRLLFPFALLGLAQAAVVFGPRADGRLRVAAILGALLAPACDGPASFWATAVTVLAVATAMRIVDLDAFLRSGSTSRLELWAWLGLPVFKSWPRSLEQRQKQRKKAPRLLLGALAQYAAWQLLALGARTLPEAWRSWPLASVLLIFFFVLHFGALADAVSALLAACGAQLEPIFEAPLLSRSPRDFWSRRWNKFVARFLLKYVALILPRGWPLGGVVSIVFLASGLLHEYFAWGAVGFGYPAGEMLIFFLLQGGAVLVERRLEWQPPRPLGILLTFSWMTLTAPLFFHPLTACLPAFGYPDGWLPY